METEMQQPIETDCLCWLSSRVCILKPDYIEKHSTLPNLPSLLHTTAKPSLLTSIYDIKVHSLRSLVSRNAS